MTANGSWRKTCAVLIICIIAAHGRPSNLNSSIGNFEQLEILNGDKHSSRQVCVCSRKPNDCICDKEWSINLGKGEISNFPDHGFFQRTNEFDRDVKNRIYNKRGAGDHTTLPPFISRLPPGSLLRTLYVNQPDELKPKLMETLQLSAIISS